MADYSVKSTQFAKNKVEDGDTGGSDIIRLKSVSTSGSLKEPQQRQSDNPDGEDALTSVPFTPLINNNQYTVRKMAAQAMMDVALMMANISQLRTLLSGGETHISYFPFLMAMVVFSLTSQVVFGILIFIIWVRESAAHQRDEFERSMREKEFRSISTSADNSPEAVTKMRMSMARQRDHYDRELVTNRLNHVTMVLVFLITVANMFITGFGIETPNDWDKPHAINGT